MNISDTVFTVSQINNNVKYFLTKTYPNIFIKGEVVNYKEFQSGNSYFTIKDECASLDCVVFKANKHILKSDFKDGNNIIISGSLTLYIKSGKFQINVKEIIDKPTKGALWKEYEALKKKLENEGLFDGVFKKKIPKFPKNIAVITSEEGDVFSDICTILKRRNPKEALKMLLGTR